MAELIRIKNLIIDYIGDEEQTAPVRAIDGISLSIERGSFVAVIGRNGSGKSTLAKTINALILPTEGDVIVNGCNTKEEAYLWEIRQSVAMVFQNPDNQIVSSIVEDDVAFGPENLGVDPKEIRRRVDQSLEAVRMGAYKAKAPHMLSGGQKQRIAIAGAIAMQPQCIVFDEPTAMLDPNGRRDVMEIIHHLHGNGMTCILITHFMEEAAQADRMIIMDRGKVDMDGTPADIFSKRERLRELGLDVPMAVELSWRLREHGVPLPETVTQEEELIRALCRLR